jgi:hypothetical protein
VPKGGAGATGHRSAESLDSCCGDRPAIKRHGFVEERKSIRLPHQVGFVPCAYGTTVRVRSLPSPPV